MNQSTACILRCWVSFTFGLLSFLIILKKIKLCDNLYLQILFTREHVEHVASEATCKAVV